MCFCHLGARSLRIGAVFDQFFSENLEKFLGACHKLNFDPTVSDH